jgi:hypothetical protein
MLVTHTHTSKDKVTGEARTKTVEMRAERLSLPDDFIQAGDNEWIKATETRLSVHEHIVTVTH